MDILNHLYSHIDDVLTGGATFWLVSGLISTMPKPNENERWYGWLFNFAQFVAANWKTIGNKEIKEKEKE